MDKRYYFIAEEARRQLVAYCLATPRLEQTADLWRRASVAYLLGTATADRLCRKADMSPFMRGAPDDLDAPAVGNT